MHLVGQPPCLLTLSRVFSAKVFKTNTCRRTTYHCPPGSTHVIEGFRLEAVSTYSSINIVATWSAEVFAATSVVFHAFSHVCLAPVPVPEGYRVSFCLRRWCLQLFDRVRKVLDSLAHRYGSERCRDALTTWNHTHNPHRAAGRSNREVVEALVILYRITSLRGSLDSGGP